MPRVKGFYLDPYNSMRWMGHIVHMGERRGAHRVFVVIPEGKRPIERPRHRWQDSSKMDLKKWYGSMDCIVLAQDMDTWKAVVNAVMNH